MSLHIHRAVSWQLSTVACNSQWAPCKPNCWSLAYYKLDIIPVTQPTANRSKQIMCRHYEYTYIRQFLFGYLYLDWVAKNEHLRIVGAELFTVCIIFPSSICVETMNTETLADKQTTLQSFFSIICFHQCTFCSLTKGLPGLLVIPKPKKSEDTESSTNLQLKTTISPITVN